MHNDGLGRLLRDGTSRLINLHSFKDSRTFVQLRRRSHRRFIRFLCLSRWSCAVLGYLWGSFRGTDLFESIAQLVTVPQRSMKDLRSTRVNFILPVGSASVANPHHQDLPHNDFGFSVTPRLPLAIEKTLLPTFVLVALWIDRSHRYNYPHGVQRGCAHPSRPRLTASCQQCHLR